MTTAGTVARVRSALTRAWARLSGGWWSLLQQTAAATIAWMIAGRVVDHHEPFFAPIAAVVSLNASFGERGSNTFSLLRGVLVGIIVGEVTIGLFDQGVGRLGLAVLVAMAIAKAIGGARVTVAQAASGAILTVATSNAGAGPDRVVDALIGAGVALVFSQVVFSPEPVGLLRRAESAALGAMADGLRLTARGPAEDDDVATAPAADTLRDLRGRLAELDRVRRASTRMARHSLVWRWRAAPVVHEKENASRLGLLGDSCVLLIRTTAESTAQTRRTMAPVLATLAEALADLAVDLGDRERRQRAVGRALPVARGLSVQRPQGNADPGGDGRTAATPRPLVSLTRIVAMDLVVFAGVEPARAAAAVHRTNGEPAVDEGRPTPRGLAPAISRAVSRVAPITQRRRGRQDRRRDGDR